MAAIFWDRVSLAVGALAAVTATTANSRADASRLQGFRILRTEYYGSIKNLTEGEGPLLLGLTHDLSNAEIAETFLGDPQRTHDPVETEKAGRPVWGLESLAIDVNGQGKMVFQGVAKIGWSVPEGTALKWFIMNMNQSAAMTTGATLVLFAKHFGVWLKD